MPGRHTAPAARRREFPALQRWVIPALVGVVVVAGGVVAVEKIFRGGCDHVTHFTVAADPSIAPALSEIVGNTSDEDLGCAQLQVNAVPSAVMADTATDPASRPALWVPESSLWVDRAARRLAAPLDIVATSVATTPGVVASRKGDVPAPASWLDVLRQRGLRLGDPLTDGAARTPIVGALAEIEAGNGKPDALMSALVPIGQAHAANPRESLASQRLSAVAKDGASAIATEQQVLTFDRDNPATRLAATVPKSGAAVLNYPLAVTAPAGPGHDAAKSVGNALADVLSGGSAAEVLSQAGFRDRDAKPLDGDRGVGKVAALTVADRSLVSGTLKRYAALSLPPRSLAVVDVSGSMRYLAGAGTRIDLTSQAAEAGIRLFPDTAQLGLWAFSTGLGGPKQDWRELVPIRRIGDSVGGVTQRDVMVGQMRKLKSLVGGGTGLYETVLAAWRKVKDGYDPKAVNSVIVMTDGSNEALDSIGLDQLLDTLHREQDPAKPVVIVTVGITQDADATVLQKISSATGGTSYIARNPAEIPNVYIDAINARQSGS